KGLEFYHQNNNIIRLNTGRTAIWHAFRLTGAERIWIPYYQCDSVRDFLCKKGVEVHYYSIDRHFNPVDLRPDEEDAVLLVNYFGVMSASRMADLARPYPHSIIDNCQAFFCVPLAGAYNVYSARKFVGVPDGAYVIGPDAELYLSSYPQGYSSDTALFLLQRIEYGCEGKGYESRMVNEHRIDSEDIMKMSPLTRSILDGTDYTVIRETRRENFGYAHSLFARINQLDAMQYYDEDTVPMVYPLVMEDDAILGRLLQAKHFQGHWWSYLLDEVPDDSFEYWLSRYMIPITIDQRYGQRDLDYLADIIL
ncbi:MAG: hypothetical protein K5651_06655, partial [Bacteroidales bacterium]|nr:hypothetical protein [Bacteroidales bacterium]